MPVVKKTGKTKHFSYGKSGKKAAAAYAKKVGGKVSKKSAKKKYY